MAEQAGIDLMRRRIERASRQPPPPRRASESPSSPATPPPTSPPAASKDEAKEKEKVAPTPAPSRSARNRPATPTRLRLAADVAPVNLAIRVRRPLDDRLADTIHALRGHGVRTSKVELIEMLLWELPDDRTAEVRERLRQFRDWAPRGTSAPLEAEGD
mgnify:FL=1